MISFQLPLMCKKLKDNQTALISVMREFSQDANFVAAMIAILMPAQKHANQVQPEGHHASMPLLLKLAIAGRIIAVVLCTAKSS